MSHFTYYFALLILLIARLELLMLIGFSLESALNNKNDNVVLSLSISIFCSPENGGGPSRIFYLHPRHPPPHRHRWDLPLLLEVGPIDRWYISRKLTFIYH